MIAWRRWVVTALTWILLAFARRTASLSDRGLAWVVRMIRRFLRDPVARNRLTELSHILLQGPPGTVVLRKILTGVHPAEVRDLVAGALFFEEWDPVEWP